MGELRYIFSNETSGRPYHRGPVKNYRTKDNACVVFDGDKVVYASETERFSKIKHDYAMPLEPLRAFKDSFQRSYETLNLKKVNHNSIEKNHHQNHMYEAFYQSGFSEAAVLVNDGTGNLNDSLTLAYMEESCKPYVLKKFPTALSPAGLYGNESRALYFDKHSQGKLMGLAAWGKSNGKTYIEWDNKTKSIHKNSSLLYADIEQCFDVANDSLHENKMLACDIAYTVQANYEQVLVGVVRYLKQLLKEQGIQTKNLCMSGGGVLNCPANSRIVDLGLFENFYASPQPSDGCAESIGRAFRIFEASGEKLKSQRLETAFLGATYPACELPFKYEVLENPFASLVQHLMNGGIIAWFQDGAEYGPRALGHRSFLADPSSTDMLHALNTLKNREQWRPLAPIVPEELFMRLFNVSNTDMCEFMLRTLTVKERWRSRMQAVCHTDGSTRPQLLRRVNNTILHELLMQWFNETHIPCLVNTSLNINGFPIVETPRDLCNLAEEISFLKAEIPDVLTIFVEGKNIFEVVLPQGELE